MLVSQLLARLLVLSLEGVGRQHLFCEWHSVDHRVIDAVVPTVLYTIDLVGLHPSALLCLLFFLQGHATSKDLVQWQPQPVALEPSCFLLACGVK
jgi:hypothetical protein